MLLWQAQRPVGVGRIERLALGGTLPHCLGFRLARAGPFLLPRIDQATQAEEFDVGVGGALSAQRNQIGTGRSDARIGKPFSDRLGHCPFGSPCQCVDPQLHRQLVREVIALLHPILSQQCRNAQRQPDRSNRRQVILEAADLSIGFGQ